MNTDRFDAFTRLVASTTTRRTVLVLATALGLSARFSEAKKHKKKKKSCKKKRCGECQICRKGKCKPKADGTACSTGTCEGGVCIGFTNCPTDRRCELAERCCSEDLDCSTNGACRCGDGEQPLCGCLAGHTLCQGTETESCCLSGDICDPSGLCVNPTCSAGNAFCEAGPTVCGFSCGCFTTADGSPFCAHVGASFELFACPPGSECTTDAECIGNGTGDACVDVSCCGEGGFFGRCLFECNDPL